MSILSLDLLIFDYLILAITTLIIIFSFWKGFINSILGLLTWVGSVFITIYSYEYISGYLTSLFLNINFLNDFGQFISIISIIISIPLIFLLSLFVLKRIRKILSSDLDKQTLGLIIDKIFGFIYGIIFSYVIYSTVLHFTNSSEISILNNLYIFLIDNSNIFNQINQYNENIIENYINKS